MDVPRAQVGRPEGICSCPVKQRKTDSSMKELQLLGLQEGEDSSLLVVRMTRGLLLLRWIGAVVINSDGQMLAVTRREQIEAR